MLRHHQALKNNVDTETVKTKIAKILKVAVV
jgi:hypothetical protein